MASDGQEDADAVLSDVESDEPAPIVINTPSEDEVSVEKFRDLLAELHRERQAREAAEKTKLDLETSFSRLKALAHEALKKRDECARQRDDAVREKEEALRSEEKISAELIEANRTKDEASKLIDEAVKAKDSLRSEVENASHMLVTGIDKISRKVSNFKNFSAGGLPRSQKYTGLPAIAYGVIKRTNEIVEELVKQIDTTAKSRNDAREQMEQRNYEIAIEVSQLEATISRLREEVEKKTSMVENMEKAIVEKDGKISEIEREMSEKLNLVEKEALDLRQLAGEYDDKLRNLESKMESQRPLLIDQLNYVSRIHELIYDAIKIVDANNFDQLESLYLPEETLEENVRASLAGMESIYELTRIFVGKARDLVEDRSREVKVLNETVGRLVKEKEQIGSLLRSALSKRMTSDPSSKTSDLFQVAENGLREAGIDFKFSKHLVDGKVPVSHDKADVLDTEEEDEIYTLAGALENIVKASQLEIIELRHSVEELRAESNLLKEHVEAQAKELNHRMHRIEELKEKERIANESVEGLMMDIAASEEEITRWKVAAEQEAAAGKAVELEFMAQLSALRQELGEAKQSVLESASVEEYLQQVHEMAMVSAIQEAQKDNISSFNDYMMKVLEEDWQKEKRDFLQSLSRISTLPRTNMIDTSAGGGQIVSMTSSPHVSSGPSSMELVPLANKPILDKKASVYADIVKNLNNARERGLPFKLATGFKSAYESLGLDTSGGKSVNMQKIWHLIWTLMGEDATIQFNVSRKMSLVIGARHHLERGHEKYVMDTIQSHPAQAALGGVVGNLQRVHAFLRIRLRDYGVLDFDAGDARRQPPVDTTWQQIYFCLRTGYYNDARNVAQSSRASHQFAPLLTDWINTGGMVSLETAAAASEECEKMLRVGDRMGRSAYDKKKLLLYAIVSGSRRQIDRLLRELPTLFNTIEDFLWFKLSAVRDSPSGASSVVVNEGLVPYSLDDLQIYLNKFEPSYYTKNGKDPLVYPYVLLLSIQLLPAVLYLSKEIGDEGYNIDAAHISIVLADHGVLSEGAGAGQKLGVMDALAEASGIIRQYGSLYLRLGNLSMALEYYAQAAAAVGGGQLSWTGRVSVDQQRQRSLMLKQLLTELLLRDGGIYLLLGSRGAGEEGELGRFLTDVKARQHFLLEVANRCQESGLYDKSIEIQKRVGAFSMALDTINKCLSEAICALSRGRLDGESRTAGLIHSGNEILEAYKYYPEVSHQERDHVLEQQTVLRQLEAILSIHKLARGGHHVDALREVAKLPFLPLDPRAPDMTADAYQNLSPHVQACVPDLLKVALTCLDNVTDSDGSLRALRAKIASFLANNLNRNWPRDLYEKVARSL